MRNKKGRPLDATKTKKEKDSLMHRKPFSRPFSLESWSLFAFIFRGRRENKNCEEEKKNEKKQMSRRIKKTLFLSLIHDFFAFFVICLFSRWNLFVNEGKEIHHVLRVRREHQQQWLSFLSKVWLGLNHYSWTEYVWLSMFAPRNANDHSDDLMRSRISCEKMLKIVNPRTTRKNSMSKQGICYATRGRRSLFAVNHWGISRAEAIRYEGMDAHRSCPPTLAPESSSVWNTSKMRHSWVKRWSSWFFPLKSHEGLSWWS